MGMELPVPQQPDQNQDAPLSNLLSDAQTPRTARPAPNNVDQILGNVTIGESVASGIGQIAETLQRNREINEIAGKMRQMKEIPLSRTEQFHADSLSSAMRNLDTKAVNRILGVLADNPSSVDRVMRQIRSQFGDKPNAVNWEKGTDDQGNSFVRMRLSQYDKFGGITAVTLGSDGTQTATYTKFKGANPEPIDAGQALQTITANKKIIKWGEGSNTPETLPAPAHGHNNDDNDEEVTAPTHSVRPAKAKFGS